MTNKVNCAYIAGFLDGDGSLMLQLKKRKDGDKTGTRFMATICFYQDSRHDIPLCWIREQFGIGYLSKRNDGMSELRINGFKQIREILESLLPYIRFKKIQAKALHEACGILSTGMMRMLDKKSLKRLVKLIMAVQNENYATKKKKTESEFMEILGLTP